MTVHRHRRSRPPTCNVTGLTAKTAYTFKVTATNQYGTSVPSAASDVGQRRLPRHPDQRLGRADPNVANASTGQVTVSWTVPNNGGAALTTQTATSSSGSKTCTDTTHLTAGQTATCNVTGLTNGTTYTFTVKATNANGTGAASAASNSVVVETTPAAPTAVSATAGNASATVSFTGAVDHQLGCHHRLHGDGHRLPPRRPTAARPPRAPPARSRSPA